MSQLPRKVLVVGGTGPSGPYVVEDLLRRGCEPVILHRGVHEPTGLPPVRHIHADPHFAESVRAILGQERFDAVIAMYGRLEVLARVFAGRCDRFVAVGGRPAYAGFLDPASAVPKGMKILNAEAQCLAEPDLIADEGTRKFVAKVLAAERTVFELHRAGAYAATLLRYPMIYGPRAIVPMEWSIVKRIIDGRKFVLLPDAGLGVMTRCSAANAARHVVLCLERQEAVGEIFNCADEDAYSMAQWVEMIATALGTTLDVVDVPGPLRWATRHLSRSFSDHALADTSKARALLGYRDVIPAARALAEFVHWLSEHPLGAVSDAVFGDAFDYRLEDRLRDELLALAARCEPLRKSAAAGPTAHMYAHPKAPTLAPDHLGR